MIITLTITITRVTPPAAAAVTTIIAAAAVAAAAVVAAIYRNPPVLSRLTVLDPSSCCRAARTSGCTYCCQTHSTSPLVTSGYGSSVPCREMKIVTTRLIVEVIIIIIIIIIVITVAMIIIVIIVIIVVMVTIAAAMTVTTTKTISYEITKKTRTLTQT